MHFVRTFYRFNGETSLLLFQKSTNWVSIKTIALYTVKFPKRFTNAYAMWQNLCKSKPCVFQVETRNQASDASTLTHAYRHILLAILLAVSAIYSEQTLQQGSDCHFMLVSPNECETAVHGFHSPGNMAVCMRKVLTRP